MRILRPLAIGLVTLAAAAAPIVLAAGPASAGVIVNDSPTADGAIVQESPAARDGGGGVADFPPGPTKLAGNYKTDSGNYKGDSGNYKGDSGNYLAGTPDRP